MTDRRIDLGPTGETVRANVTYLREDQNLTYAELSRRLEDVGNPIPPLGLRRIEAGERRVHVDDLMALAAVFGAAPSSLLMPRTSSKDDQVTATGVGERTAQDLWDWMKDGSTRTESGTLKLSRFPNPEWVTDREQELRSETMGKLVKRLGLAVDFGDD